MPPLRWPPDLPADGGWAPVAAFGGKSSMPPPPAPAPPQPMPDLNDPALQALKRREQEARSRGGRISTMLTDSEYASDKLGLR